jgi:hypothetical protein
VQADEEIRLVVVRHRGALVERYRLIGVARQNRAHAQTGFERGFEPPRHAQRDVLLERAVGSFGTLLVAAVARIDHDRPKSA